MAVWKFSLLRLTFPHKLIHSKAPFCDVFPPFHSSSLSLCFCPIISVMNLRKEKGKLKKQKNEIKRKNFELTNWIIFYFLLFYACMNEEFFIIFCKEMLNFLSFYVKRLPLFFWITKLEIFLCPLINFFAILHFITFKP